MYLLSELSATAVFKIRFVGWARRLSMTVTGVYNWIFLLKVKLARNWRYITHVCTPSITEHCKTAVTRIQGEALGPVAQLRRDMFPRAFLTLRYSETYHLGNCCLRWLCSLSSYQHSDRSIPTQFLFLQEWDRAQHQWRLLKKFW